MMQGQSRIPVSLSKIAFAIEEAGTSKLGRFDIPRPKMWENIGPVKDTFGSIIAVVRVVNAHKALEPKDINLSFSKKDAVLEVTADTGDDYYSVREAVVKDVKLIKAMQAAKLRAEELGNKVADKGWDDAIAEYNERYTTEDVEIQTLSEQNRVSLMEISAVKMILKDEPAQASYLKKISNDKILMDKLYALLPAGETETVNPGVPGSIVEFKPDASYYVVKKVSRTAVTQKDYSMSKSQMAYMLDGARSESLGIVFYTPENIYKRMNYRSADADEKDQPEEGKDAQ
jgi:hypothetical protein